MSLDSDNRFDLAVMKFESMLKSNSVYFFDAEDFTDIITHYLEEGKMFKAKKAIQLGLEQHPKDTEINILKSQVFILEDKLDMALQLLLELEILEVSNPEIYVHKASIYSKKRNHQKAVKMLKKALSYVDEDDEVSDIYSLLGMEYLFMEDYHKAKLYYKACLKCDKEDYTAFYNVIYCFDYLKDSSGAIIFLNKYLDDSPYCELAWHQLGLQYTHIHLLKEAIACFDFAIISDESFIGAYLEKGKVLESLSKYEEAIESYNYTLHIEDQTAFAFFRIGLCYYAMGDYDLALTNLKKSINEDSLLDKAWFAISKIYHSMNKLEKAYESVKKAIEISDDVKAYWIKLSELTLALDLDKESVKVFNKLLKSENPNPENYFVLSKMQLRLGNVHEAVSKLQESLSFFEDFPKLIYLLSVAYFIKLDKEKGLQLMSKALYIDYDMYKEFEKEYPQIFKIEEVNKLIFKFKK